MKRTMRVGAFVALLTAAHPPAPLAAQAAASDTMSSEARAYLLEAIRLMRENSLHRAELDWEAIERDAFERAGNAQDPADTYEAIREALRALGDRHSFLILPEGIPAGSGGTAAPPVPGGEMIDGRWAYVSVPLVGANAIADSILSIVDELAAQNACGWIVDLRENLGGNMWPMLLGLSPLFGSGEVGAFVSPGGASNRWIVRPGEVGIDDNRVLGTDRALPDLSDAPVAVLLGGRTVSSGEAIAVAFEGRPRTRSFGQATFGLSSGNQPFPLSDGAQLNLTVALFADREGTVFGGPIEPDEVVEGLTDYAVISAAIRWLRGMAGGCT